MGGVWTFRAVHRWGIGRSDHHVRTLCSRRTGPGPRSGRIGLRAAGVAVAGLAAGLGLRAAARWLHAGDARDVPPSPFAAPAKVGVEAKAARRAAEAAADAAAAAGGKPAAVLAAVRVSVTATEECWIQWQLDDRRPEDATLKAGEPRFWTGSARVRLLIGNAAAARVSGPAGPVALPAKARVVHLLFTPQGMERLPVPQASSTVTP